jgi:hypothetical protein
MEGNFKVRLYNKGQLISKCLLGIFNSPKKRTKKIYFRDHSSITSAKMWVGGVRKWQFLLMCITIYADVGEWLGLKKPKTC